VNLQAVDNATLFINKTAVYYLMFANCQPNVTIRMTGPVVWLNPYGYLGGQLLGSLVAYWILFALYTPLLIGYALLCFRHRKHLLGLQIGVLAFIGVAWFEVLFYGWNFTAYNNFGDNNDTANILGAVFDALKGTGIRIVLLLCALGFSITTRTISKGAIAGLVAVSLAYSVVSFINTYTLVASYSLSIIVHPVMAKAFGYVQVIVNFAYAIWIGLAFYWTMKSMRADKEVEKYGLYWRLIVLLIACASLAIILYIAQAVILFSGVTDQSFRVLWLFTNDWDFFYFVIIVAIAFIWRPSESNDSYAFSQLPSRGAHEALTPRDKAVALEDDTNAGDVSSESKSL
jgi:hypothetical protein